MMMSMMNAKTAIENGSDTKDILASLSIVRIRRLSSEMGLGLARSIWRNHKAEIISAFVAAMQKEPEAPATNIPRAVRIVAAQKSYEDIISIGMRMMGASHALADRLYDVENALKEKQDACFMEVLKERLEMGETNIPAAIAIIEEAAQTLVDRCEERNEHNWVCKSDTADYTADSKAFEAALAEMNRILDTVKEGGNFVRAISLKRTASKINSASIDGGYSVSAKIWHGKGKVRIYVNVYDANGKPQLATPYLEDGAVRWQVEPRTRPVWADSVVAAMKAAV